MDDQIIEKVKVYAVEVLEKQLDSVYTYHNLAHTKRVVEHAELFGKAAGLDEVGLQDVIIAAWFHDLGYTVQVEGHESISADLARIFLTTQNYPEERISSINAMIAATAYGVVPETLPAQVLKDADVSHLGTPLFSTFSASLRGEWETVSGQAFTEAEWKKMNVEFLSAHKYYTTPAQELLNKGLAENLTELKSQLEAMEQSEDKNESASEQESVSNNAEESASTTDDTPETSEEVESAAPAADAEPKAETDEVVAPVDATTESAAPKPKKKKKKKKPAKPKAPGKPSDSPGRGVETMFRVTLKNHLALSQIADNKANIMLSINAIIISIVLTALLPRIDDNSELVIPLMILLVVCVLSIVFATISTIPKVSRGDTSKADIEARRTNLLFFGNFHKMDLDDYIWGMEEMMKDNEFLYHSMMKDLYFLGKVLHKKYQYLRITYAVFMTGMVAAVIAFVYAFVK